MSDGYRIMLYEDSAEDMIQPDFDMPTLPYPGLRIAHGSGVWEVLRVQLHITDRASVAYRDKDPLLVQVAVQATTGIHRD